MARPKLRRAEHRQGVPGRRGGKGVLALDGGLDEELMFANSMSYDAYITQCLAAPDVPEKAKVFLQMLDWVIH